jgi:hypothetical protein
MTINSRTPYFYILFEASVAPLNVQEGDIEGHLGSLRGYRVPSDLFSAKEVIVALPVSSSFLPGDEVPVGQEVGVLNLLHELEEGSFPMLAHAAKEDNRASLRELWFEGCKQAVHPLHVGIHRRPLVVPGVLYDSHVGRVGEEKGDRAILKGIGEVEAIERVNVGH